MPDDKPRVEKVSIALTADMAAMIRQAVDGGEYASASEVVREALRDWKYKQQQREQKIAELKALLEDGEASGTSEWTGVADILTKARRRSEAR